MDPRYPAWVERMTGRSHWQQLAADHPDKKPTIHQYRRDRFDAAVSEDISDMVSFLTKYGIELPESETIERYRQRLRANLPKIPYRMRQDAVTWLRQHNDR